jgi:hypothetical protein
LTLSAEEDGDRNEDGGTEGDDAALVKKKRV